MLTWHILKWIFGKKSDAPANQVASGAIVENSPPTTDKSAPIVAPAVLDGESLSQLASSKTPARGRHARAPVATKTRKSVAERLPEEEQPARVNPPPDIIDLDIGLDIGTSCTKAVLGDRESNEQTAIPLNGGRKLAGFLLPTLVYVKDGAYALEPSEGAIVARNLKIRLIHAGKSGIGHKESGAICDLTAFTALTLRRVLEWHSSGPSSRSGRRIASWNLNVGLPSRGSPKDPFESIYRGIVETAVRLVPGDTAITKATIAAAMTQRGQVDWLPASRIHYYPEAAAQLASLIYSPHRPEGCLLVVDVGAGTLDVSTIRVGSRATGVRCSFHFCEVAPLGVHFLHLARRGQEGRNDAMSFERLLESIPDDTGSNAIYGTPQAEPPAHFHERCRGVLMGNVVRYRKRLRDAHASRAFRPWVDGLPYVLSGGGRRDPYFQKLLCADLEGWLSTVCSEWDQSLTGAPHRGLQLRSFPTPKAFGPRYLAPEFDRFSVAHGLSLGAENLMEIIQARSD